MKKVWSLAFVCLALLSGAHAQESFGLANSATGTTLNTLTKVVVNGGVPQAEIVATTDTSGAVGITTLGNGTTGTAIVTRSGIAPCVFDNTVVAGHFVQIAPGTAGDCHDAGATRPTSGQIIGIVIQTGGSAGTYNVLLDKSILPSSSAPLCQPLGSSDTLSQTVANGIGTFATTCSVPSTAISGVGQFIEVIAHGTYTTSATASPVLNFSVNGGGSTPVCSFSTNVTTGLSLTSVWDLHCFIHILTTGSPGTANTWGAMEVGATAGGTATVFRNWKENTTVSFITNSTQSISISQTATMVSGESATLTDLIVRNY
jgi:hypothetical protein